MAKKFGALGLMLGAGLLFVHPSIGNAQDRYGRGTYYYYDDRGHNRDYERQRLREERKERKWREKELREREKWERRNYRNYYNGYRSDRYSNNGYRDPYRPY